MNSRLICLGHKMPAFVEQGVSEYLKRLPKEYALDVVEIKPAAATAGGVEKRLAEEAAKIRLAIPKGSALVVLDERGKDLTSKAFAQALAAWRADGRRPCFVIGSADGLSAEIKAEANALIRLSSLTLPHALARLVLAEQIYRAVTLLQNHPYHRE